MSLSPSSVASGALAAFWGIEALLRRGAGARSLRAGRDDRGTTLAIVAAYAGVAACLALPLGGPRIGVAGRWLGVGAAWAGVALRVAAFRALGAGYSRTLRVADGQALVTRGVYGAIRHPGYASSLAIWGGAAVASGSAAAAAVIGALLAATYAFRIRVEERMLLREFGADYAAYRARTWRLLPWLY